MVYWCLLSAVTLVKIMVLKAIVTQLVLKAIVTHLVELTVIPAFVPDIAKHYPCNITDAILNYFSLLRSFH